MDQALVQEVEPALVAEVNEDTSGEQYADECGIPIGSQDFKLMDGSTLFWLDLSYPGLLHRGFKIQFQNQFTVSLELL